MELGKQYKSFVKGKVLDVIGCKRKINHFLYDSVDEDCGEIYFEGETLEQAIEGEKEMYMGLLL